MRPRLRVVADQPVAPGLLGAVQGPVGAAVELGGAFPAAVPGQAGAGGVAPPRGIGQGACGAHTGQQALRDDPGLVHVHAGQQQHEFFAAHAGAAVFAPGAGFGERLTSARTGWNVGAGVNFAFTDHLILGAEYRYTDFGRNRFASSGAFPGLSGSQDLTSHSARASVAYKF